MGHPYLSGVWSKLERADKKFADVGPKLTAGFGPDQNSIKRYGNPNRGRFIYVWVQRNPSYWVDVSLDVGEVCHHLRSCLDHIAWAFARVGAERDGRTVPHRFTSFPLVEDQSNWNRAARNVLRDVPQTGQAFIERFQPYQKRSRSFNRRLEIIDKLNNTDKHALINITDAVATYANKKTFDRRTGRVSRTETIRVENAKPGAILHTIDNLGANVKVEVNFGFKHFIEEAREGIRIELRAEFPRLIRAVRFVASKAESAITAL